MKRIGTEDGTREYQPLALEVVSMRGVVCYRDGITICARDYRKTPCFVIFREVQE